MLKYKQQLLLMFNNYIAKKRELQAFKKLQQAKDQLQRKNKYRSEIQAQLLENHNQRVNSFMYQMHKNTILIEDITKREQQYERGGFIYKNCQDWKSFNTVSQRFYLKSKKNNRQQWSQTSQKTQFSPNVTQYRIRNKSKQINHPMKFGKMMIQVIEPQRKRYQSLNIIRKNSRRQDQSIENDVQISHKQITSKESDANSDFLEIKGRTQDVQIDKEEERRRKNLNKNKRHFKKLITLSLLGEQKYKKQIKQILNKCGYIKKKEKNSSEVQIDPLVRILQKIRQK